MATPISRRTLLAAGAGAAAGLSLPAAAHAGDPILPLSQVQSGMRCRLS